MPKHPLRIEVVRSTFKHISSMGETSARDIVATLSEIYSDVVMTNVDTIAELEALVARKPDLVFSGIYFIRDESRNGAKVWLSDILEQHGIAHTGSGKLANRLSLNKDLAKRRMVERNVRTAKYKLIPLGTTDTITEGDLSFPLFVKPSNKSGRQGVDVFSVVHNTEQLVAKVTSIHNDDQSDALVEEYLPGREFTVALIGTLDDDFVAMPFELIAAADANGNRIRSHFLGTSDADDMKAIEDPAERLLLETFAISAFRALGGVGYSRIDVRFDTNGVPFFLEANNIPSLSRDESAFPKAYNLTFGYSYEALITHIVSLALKPQTEKNFLAI